MSNSKSKKQDKQRSKKEKKKVVRDEDKSETKPKEKFQYMVTESMKKNLFRGNALQNLTRKEAEELCELSSTIAYTATGDVKKFAERVRELFKPEKKKRHRTIMTEKQSAILLDLFEQDAFPPTEMREELARSIGMSPRSVQVWFQNQRQKYKQRLLNMDWSGLDILANAAIYVSSTLENESQTTSVYESERNEYDEEYEY